MTGEYVFQWAIILFIIASIVWHVFKGGASNPESTGQLGKRVGRLSLTMTELGGRLTHVEEKLDELERSAATTSDIDALAGRLDERTATLRAEMKGHHDLSERTNKSVERIERFLIERGINGK